MTRGDGGQNLIGSEQSEYVGLLRTHELLAARGVDGGEQYFTRANDFGFTKTTDEALATWGKQQVLSDLVWRIRSLKPDVIINRFPPDNRAGHGHHSASAVLSAEAFKLAADPTAFPEQLKYVSVWQAKRLVWNSYTPGFQNNAPDGSYIKVPLGNYNPLLGKSYPEIAAEARSMHKSQGFGAAKVRNQRFDYALHVAGEAAQNDLFDGVDLSWNRIKGGNKIAEMVNNAIKSFDAENPAKLIPALQKIHAEIEKLEKNVWTDYKKKQVEELIIACAGLWFEANAADYSAARGEKVKINVNVVQRSDAAITLQKVILGANLKDSVMNVALKNNEALSIPLEMQIPVNQEISQPYWLIEPKEKGFYKVENQELRGLPMKPSNLVCEYQFLIDGKKYSFQTPINYKYVEPADGEFYRYFEIRPEICVNIDQKVYALADNQAKEVSVTVKASKSNTGGVLTLAVKDGWKFEPASIPFELKAKNEEKKFTFKVFPPLGASETTLQALVITKTDTLKRGIASIDYKHIPKLTLYPNAEAKLLKIDLQKKGTKIGYIAGTGDEVPAALLQIGYEVSMLTQNDFAKDLSIFDAIIVGVRAYNTEDWLKFQQEKLMSYVENGGNMIVQYQTNAFYGTPKTSSMGPYTFGIGRNRVTDEDAEVKFIKPEHSLLNYPNKITSKDFSGWIQERGLYFADKWSDKYETILMMHDQNETEQEGSLLYAKYGKGNYIFTGLAFFRQLPAGVSGAYRLFANMISVGKP